jgi:hypothetical protein
MSENWLGLEQDRHSGHVVVDPGVGGLGAPRADAVVVDDHDQRVGRRPAQDGLDVVAGARVVGRLVAQRGDLEAKAGHRLTPVVAEVLAADVVEPLAERDRRAVDDDRDVARQLAQRLGDAVAIDLIEDLLEMIHRGRRVRDRGSVDHDGGIEPPPASTVPPGGPSCCCDTRSEEAG